MPAMREVAGGGTVTELVDDVSTKRVGMPRDLQGDINLLGEVRAARDAKAPVGAKVTVNRVGYRGKKGTVIPPETAMLRQEERAAGFEQALVRLDDGGILWVHMDDIAP